LWIQIKIENYIKLYPFRVSVTSFSSAAATKFTYIKKLFQDTHTLSAGFLLHTLETVWFLHR